jgi:hypothetical protein
MEQDKSAKDEIAQGMADAGKAGGKPTTDQGNQPSRPEKDIAAAGAKASPKMPSSEPATKSRD